MPTTPLRLRASAELDQLGVPRAQLRLSEFDLTKLKSDKGAGKYLVNQTRKMIDRDIVPSEAFEIASDKLATKMLEHKERKSRASRASSNNYQTPEWVKQISRNGVINIGK